MQYSIRTLFGLTLLSAVLFNPARFFFNSLFFQSLYEAFININLWFASWFLNFEPNYFALNPNVEPISPWGALAGAGIAIVIWMGIIFWGSCALLEIFRIKTPLRDTLDMLEYKIKMARYKHPN